MREIDFYEREFELGYLKSRGAAFQDLFAEILERAHPGDFQRIRSHGRAGDLKCDGYLQSGRTVFQVYGPEDTRNLPRLLRKVRDDFDGAMRHWAGRMDQWVFVHNCRGGLPAQAVQLFDDLRGEPGAPSVEVWGYEQLRLIVRELSPEALQSLFPGPPTPLNRPHTYRLPQPDAIERYWTWLIRTTPVASTPAHISGLQQLDLPIRLIPPEQARARRGSEERALAHSATHAGAWTHAHDDGSFTKGTDRDAHDLSHVLRSDRHLLIVGDAGSGKSTLVRRFAVREARRLLASTMARAHRQTPVVVELWRFAPERPLIDLISGSVNRSAAAIAPDELVAAIERGFVVLLLDGLDEVPDAYRRECLAQIVGLGEQYPRTHLVLTSRPFPEPPEHFRCLAIAPLRDVDIATSLRARWGSVRDFRDKFAQCTPEDYVRVHIRPEVRQLCRTPLTLGLVLTLLANDAALPDTLYKAYGRFLEWLINWEVRRGRLLSAAAAIAAAEATAYTMVASDQMSLARADWARVAGHALVELRDRCVTSGLSAEHVLGVFLSTGLLQDHGGEISFSHRSFMEFLAARRILDSATPAHSDPVALNVWVARFLCGGLADVTALLEQHLIRCDDVQALMPLLKEASRSDCVGGRFQSLYHAIVDGQEMAIDLTYSLRGPEEEAFADHVDALVETCLAFRPKALSLLKDAADGVIRGVPWASSRLWFEKIVAGLEAYGWPGAPLHRRLVRMGVFEAPDAFCDDKADSEAAERTEELFGYLDAVYKDDFTAASRHLRRIAELLLGKISHDSIDPEQLTLEA